MGQYEGSQGRSPKEGNRREHAPRHKATNRPTQVVRWTRELGRNCIGSSKRASTFDVSSVGVTDSMKMHKVCTEPRRKCAEDKTQRHGVPVTRRGRIKRLRCIRKHAHQVHRRAQGHKGIKTICGGGARPATQSCQMARREAGAHQKAKPRHVVTWQYTCVQYKSNHKSSSKPTNSSRRRRLRSEGSQQ